MRRKYIDIELMRYVMIMAVAILHFSEDYAGSGDALMGGYLGVDYFFLIAGFFLASNYEKLAEKNNLVSPWNFTKTRIKKIYIPYIISIFAYTLIEWVQNEYSIGWLNNELYSKKWEFFFLHSLGAPTEFTMRSLWYLSVYIVLVYLVYFLLFHVRDAYKDVSIILTILIMVYIYVKYGCLSMWPYYEGWVSGGTLRGFAEMSNGVFLYYIVYKTDDALDEGRNTKNRLVNICKYGLIIYILWLMRRYGFDVNNFWVYFIIYLYTYLSVRFQRDEITQNKWINGIIYDLGSSNLWMYVMHLVISKLICILFPRKNFSILVVIYAILVTLTGILADKLWRAVSKK